MIEMIIACDPHGGIGLNNKLPWEHLEGDLPRFKELTTGNTVVMGRNTWDSLPRKPLPNRRNIVVSRTLKQENVPEGVEVINHINSFFYKNMTSEEKIFIIGGAKLIETTLAYVSRIHLSVTKELYECDTYTDLKSIMCVFKVITEVECKDHTYYVLEEKFPLMKYRSLSVNPFLIYDGI